MCVKILCQAALLVPAGHGMMNRDDLIELQDIKKQVNNTEWMKAASWTVMWYFTAGKGLSLDTGVVVLVHFFLPLFLFLPSPLLHPPLPHLPPPPPRPPVNHIVGGQRDDSSTCPRFLETGLLCFSLFMVGHKVAMGGAEGGGGAQY